MVKKMVRIYRAANGQSFEKTLIWYSKATSVADAVLYLDNLLLSTSCGDI